MVALIYNKLWNMKDSIIKDLRDCGNYLQFLTPLVVLLYAAWNGQMYLARTFIIYYLVCTIIQVLLKSLFNNPRPNEFDISTNKNPPLHFEWSVNKGDSFPSGHTMSAMSGGIFWSNISMGQPYIACIGIALGIITAISRVAAKAHWLRDVSFSAVLSILLWYYTDLKYLNGSGFNNLLSLFK
jgi:membrane-associated phospholipid phosphatase